MFNGLVKDSVALYAVVKVTRGARKRGESTPLVNPFLGITEDWALLKAHLKQQPKKEKVTQ
jgi:hypothetical protein